MAIARAFGVGYNEAMIAWDVVVWWYTKGWRQRLAVVRGRTDGLFDYFSITLLVQTFFSPFRQISAGRVNGPIDMRLQAFFDRLVSRLIGAAVRLIIIVCGALAIGVGLLIDGLLLVFWVFVPVFPLIGLVLWITGWMPWSR